VSKPFNFSGSMTCEIKGSGGGYTHNETQTWDITGPLVSGQEWVFPALWSAIGGGQANKQRPGVKWNASWAVAATQRVRLIIQPVGDQWRFAHWSAQAE